MDLIEFLRRVFLPAREPEDDEPFTECLTPYLDDAEDDSESL